MAVVEKAVEVRLVLDLGDEDPWPGDEAAAEAIRKHLEGDTVEWNLAWPAVKPLHRGFAVVDEADVKVVDL